MQVAAHVEPQNSAACQSLWPQPHRQAGLRNLKVQRINSMYFNSNVLYDIFVRLCSANTCMPGDQHNHQTRRPSLGFPQPKKHGCIQLCTAHVAWQNGWKLDLFACKDVEL